MAGAGAGERQQVLAGPAYHERAAARRPLPLPHHSQCV